MFPGTANFNDIQFFGGFGAASGCGAFTRHCSGPVKYACAKYAECYHCLPNAFNLSRLDPDRNRKNDNTNIFDPEKRFAKHQTLQSMTLTSYRYGWVCIS
jgi:hypothetical protein